MISFNLNTSTIQCDFENRLPAMVGGFHIHRQRNSVVPKVYFWIIRRTKRCLMQDS
nr:MAG TPA: hypothetical protein [Microviridae sp.]